jgi:hypothetical protein
MDKIAIKLTIRNEDDFLDEWFQYYISLGFTNYIIYDDESSDNSINIINFYKNFVKYIKIIKINSYKGIHYSDIYAYKMFDYILNVDVDEFLYIPKNINLVNYLYTKKKQKFSVIQILVIDCGDYKNYNNDIKNLETQKYNYLMDMYADAYDPTIMKHFFDPKNSKHKNSHTSIPINNTKIYYIPDILKNY